jgi:hypothetical protein
LPWSRMTNVAMHLPLSLLKASPLLAPLRVVTFS